MRFSAPLSVAVVGVLTWEAAIAFWRIPKYVLPSWIDIFSSIYEARMVVFPNFLITLEESIFGGLIAVLIGTVLAILCAQIKLARQAIVPYLVALNAVPIVAVAPLIILWAGNGLLSKVIISAFIAFFPIFITVFQGLMGERQKIDELFFVFGVRRSQQFALADFPASVNFVVAGLKSSLTLAVIGAVVGEFVGSDRGLGYGMLQARFSLDTPMVFAYLICSMILGLLMYSIGLMFEYFLKKSGRFF